MITGIVTATLTQLLIRRAAKKAPKTTERAKVYEALVVHLWQRTDGAQYRRLECDEPELRAILAKLALYGESNVINAIAEFFASHSSATSGAQAHSVTQIVREMRKSILTGTGSEVLNSINRLLVAESTSLATSSLAKAMYSQQSRSRADA